MSLQIFTISDAAGLPTFMLHDILEEVERETGSKITPKFENCLSLCAKEKMCKDSYTVKIKPSGLVAQNAKRRIYELVEKAVSSRKC